MEVPDLEIRAIHYCVTKWRQYLLYTPFTCYVQCQVTLKLMRSDAVHPRIGALIAELNLYDYTV